MNTLDDLNKFTQLDPAGVLGSIGMFPDQCAQAWKESSAVVFPAEYKEVSNIVVCGMGGSRFTPKTVKELFKWEITKPYEIVEDYSLPAYVDTNTLVILSSYSGTTEEIISCGLEAVKRGAKLTGVAMGGKIVEMLKSAGAPHYAFVPTHNPCGQPRIGGGYLLFGHMGLLKQLGFLSLDDQMVTEAIEFARARGKELEATVVTANNVAKQLALALKDTHPFIITSEFLRGFANGFANQINENAKMISDYRHIPELNHHLMEGLQHPETLHQNGLFVFLLSKLYSASVQKRYAITQTVVEKQNVKTKMIELTGPTKLAQVLEAFTLSGYTTFYLAALYDADPVAIPWVDYFKAELAKS